MVKKLTLIAILLFAAIVILGCTSEKTEVEEQIVEEESGVVAGTPVTETIKEVPIYQAPLDSNKFTITCKTDDDCGFVRMMTGTGEVKNCINRNAEYETEETDLCICKYIGSSTQVLGNGTELTKDNYECRHKI